MNLNVKVAQRHRALLQVNRIALTTSTTQELFAGMCEALRKLVHYDRAGLSVYDADHDSLKIVALYSGYRNSVFHPGLLLGRTNSQAGWVFEHQTHVIRRDLKKEGRFTTDSLTLEGGYRSLCSVPLVVYGNSIGVVTIASEQKNGFSKSHAQILQEISDQIALAINSITPKCHVHKETRLVCPRCIGAAGGKVTVSKHREHLSNWGKKGGRGRKKPSFT